MSRLKPYLLIFGIVIVTLVVIAKVKPLNDFIERLKA
jgi:hypothetical protein